MPPPRQPAEDCLYNTRTIGYLEVRLTVNGNQRSQRKIENRKLQKIFAGKCPKRCRNAIRVAATCCVCLIVALLVLVIVLLYVLCYCSIEQQSSLAGGYGGIYLGSIRSLCAIIAAAAFWCWLIANAADWFLLQILIKSFVLINVKNTRFVLIGKWLLKLNRPAHTLAHTCTRTHNNNKQTNRPWDTRYKIQLAFCGAYKLAQPKKFQNNKNNHKNMDIKQNTSSYT